MRSNPHIKPERKRMSLYLIAECCACIAAVEKGAPVLLQPIQQKAGELKAFRSRIATLVSWYIPNASGKSPIRWNSNSAHTISGHGLHSSLESHLFLCDGPHHCAPVHGINSKRPGKG